jgi:glycerophosphoryl diester phosphodiesterase
VHVDLKWHGYEAATVEALRRHGAVPRTLISTCHASSLRAVRALEPGVVLGLTYPFDRRQVSRHRVLAPAVWAALAAIRQTLPRRIGTLLERAGATVATLHWGVVSRAVVDRCHERGAAVVAWTVDEPQVVRRLARDGVDAIVSNDPRMLAATLTA